MTFSVIGTEEYRPNINMENYLPKEKKSSGTPFDDLLKNQNPDIDTLAMGEGSKLEQDIKKTVKGIQSMVLAYVKGRVPLGDDKFNTTDMLRSMLDMLNATGNMQRVTLQEESNKIQLQNTHLLMSQLVGKEALVKDSSVAFRGKPVTFAIEIPGEGIVQVELINSNGDTVKTWEFNGKQGTQSINWDGAKENGEKAEEDEYFIRALISNGEETVLIPTYTQKRIEQVRFDPISNGKPPVYYNGNQPFKQMLSIYSGESVLSPMIDEEA